MLGNAELWDCDLLLAEKQGGQEHWGSLLLFSESQKKK